MSKTVAEVLEELWDLGNASGLDGWIGPGRGAGEVDDYAVETRRRDVENAAAALSAAGFGLVADAKAEALEEAAAKVMGPSDVPLDGATCRWNAMTLRETAAHLRNPS